MSVQTLLALGVGVALARLLPPADFGLLAIAMVFIGLAELVASLGMGASIIQLKRLEDSHLRVATTLSVLAGTILLAVFWVAADAVAAFFRDPRIAPVLRVLAVGLWFSAVASVSRSLLMRRLDFRALFRVDVVSYVAGYAGVGITLAALDYGVWSLVLGTTASLILSALYVIRLSPLHWRPSLARREVLDLIGFGTGVSVNNMINYFAASVDAVVIARFLDSGLLGLYNRAYQLITAPLTRVAVTLSSVLFPSFAEIQEDRAGLRRAYLRGVNATALLTFPVLAGVSVAAEQVITGLYGENWRPAANALRILCVAGMFKVIFNLAGPVAKATGRIYAEVRRQLVYFGILALGCLSVVGFGIEAVSAVVVIGSLWLYYSMAQLVKRIIDCDWSEFLRAQAPGLALAAVVAVAELLTMMLTAAGPPLPAPVTLALIVGAAACAYVLGFLFLPAAIVGDMPRWLVSHYGHRIPRPARAWFARRYS